MGASVGASVGSMLVPGLGLLGSGAGGISLGGASAPPLACSAGLPVLPSDLLVLASPSSYAASSPYFGHSSLFSVSSPGASQNCSSGSALASLEKVAVAMPLGWCELPQWGGCLVLPIWK